MNPVISAQSLRKTYKLSKKQRAIAKTNDKVKVAVKDVSFSVQSGEIYGLLGPNGAGKTTTLRMLAGLITPDSGDAFVNGASIVKNPEDARRSLGFLTSELKLEEVLSPSYVFDFFSTLRDVPPEQAARRKEELFSRFDITSFAETKIVDLSTGMKQKVAIAVALAHDPDIIIFDEPTNGLDIITAKTVTDFLLEMREAGKTIILSTHIFSLVEKICDSVGIILNGTMIREGSLAEMTCDKDLESVFFDVYYAHQEEQA